MQVSNNFGLLSATVKIFQQILGLSTDILHSVKMSFNKFRTLSFKLKKQINIDELADKENFEMKRSYLTGNEIKTDLIACKIMGIRKPRTTPEVPRPTYDGSSSNVQWVEISGCRYSITEQRWAQGQHPHLPIYSWAI